MQQDNGIQYLLGLLNSDCHFGVDIGGTAGKLAYLQLEGTSGEEVLAQEKWGETGERIASLQLKSPAMGGTLHFLKWATHRVQPFCEQLKEERSRGATPPPSPRDRTVYATGGGAFKFERLVHQALGLTYHKVGEFDALVEGMRFLLENHPETVYTIHDGKEVPTEFNPETDFPCAVCNIGSGVSVLMMDHDRHERIGGTSIGGSTFYGLCRLTTKVKTFEDALELARKGKTSGVDICVGDIYGSRSEELLGLPPDVAACSFGRIISMAEEDVKPEDLAASLLAMVTQAIQQIAVSISRRRGCKAVFFTGGFLRGNELSQRRLAEFCELVGEKALFVKHADYAGALGCLYQLVKHNRLSQSFGSQEQSTAGPMTSAESFGHDEDDDDLRVTTLKETPHRCD